MPILILHSSIVLLIFLKCFELKINSYNFRILTAFISGDFVIFLAKSHNSSPKSSAHFPILKQQKLFSVILNNLKTYASSASRDVVVFPLCIMARKAKITKTIILVFIISLIKIIFHLISACKI